MITATNASQRILIHNVSLVLRHSAADPSITPQLLARSDWPYSQTVRSRLIETPVASFWGKWADCWTSPNAFWNGVWWILQTELWEMCIDFCETTFGSNHPYALGVNYKELFGSELESPVESLKGSLHPFKEWKLLVLEFTGHWSVVDSGYLFSKVGGFG